MRLLITGGAGFIGSNFVRFWVERHPDDAVVAFDVLTYAGNRPNLADVEDRIEFVRGDIGDFEGVSKTLAEHQIDVVVNFAAESHNSLAILDPSRFFRTNVLGTQTLAEAARRHGVARFHHISTCEVYGDLPLDSDEVFTEETAYRPRTPYNASKAGADHAVRAYVETYGLPATITNCCNNYGPYQFPEKVIPLFTARALDNLPLPLYASTQNRREWLHVDDHCRAIELVLRHGEVGETYNVGSGVEASIEQIADAVLDATGKPQTLKKIVPDRPSHDRRYLLDSSKIREALGWEPTVPFEQGLADTVAWYADHRSWWEPLATGRRWSRGPGNQLPPGRSVGPVTEPRRVLLTGGDGQLGRDLRRILAGEVPDGGSPVSGATPLGLATPVAEGAFEVLSTDIDTMNLVDRTAVRSASEAFRPEVVLHGGAFTSVDACESDPDTAFAVNALGTRNVAEAAAAVGAHLVYISTDYVFDGTLDRPYLEWDRPDPRSVYGLSKLAGETEARALCGPSATVVRTSWVSGAHGANMVKTVLAMAADSSRRPLRFVDDQVGCPTFTADLARAVVRLALDRRPGTFHVTNQGETSWYGLARATLTAAGHDAGLVEPIATADLIPARPAPRPANSRLDNAALRLSGLPLLPGWEDGLGRLVAALSVAD